MSDWIRREDVLDVLRNLAFGHIFQCGEYYGEDERQLTIINARKAIDVIEAMPSAEPDNQVHLCGFCKYGYPECPAEESDVIFGNGIGHDNVCACAKFEIKPERKKGKWVGDCCSCCGVSKYNYIKMVDDECGPFGTWNFCPNCGADMRGDR